MKFLLSILLTAVLAFLAGLFLPWWSIAIIAFIVALVIPQHIGLGFLSGFLAIFLLWGIIAIWTDVQNHSLLSKKIATLFPLGGSVVLLILVTSLVGAMVGGFAAMAGSSLRPK